MKIAFEKISKNHVPLLFSWLNAAHVKGLYDQGYASQEEVTAKYLAPGQTVQRFVGSIDGKPFGYIQFYEVDVAHPYAAYRHSQGRTVGIDLFIGEENYLRQNYGRAMLEQFVISLSPEIERILVDPREDNGSAIALFEKYGFKKMGEILQEGRAHSMMGMNVRQAVRGIILNEKRILLIRVKADPLKGEQKDLAEFWLTPGGKVERHEDDKQALHREIREEVGFTQVQIDHFLFLDERLDHWNQFPIRLFNRYYLVHSDQQDFSSDHLMEDEKGIVLGYKWWSIPELMTTSDIIFPRDLLPRLQWIQP